MRTALPMAPASARPPLAHAALEIGLDLVGQLEAVGGEDLDAVVLIRVVRRADDDARVGAHRRRDERDPGRRQRPHEQDVGARRDDARLQRRLEHVARQARVLADDDAPGPRRVTEPLRDRLAQPQRDLGGHGILVGDTADAVGAEEASFV
jgi:hypothetical protein